MQITLNETNNCQNNLPQNQNAEVKNEAPINSIFLVEGGEHGNDDDTVSSDDFKNIEDFNLVRIFANTLWKKCRAKIDSLLSKNNNLKPFSYGGYNISVENNQYKPMIDGIDKTFSTKEEAIEFVNQYLESEPQKEYFSYKGVSVAVYDKEGFFDTDTHQVLPMNNNYTQYSFRLNGTFYNAQTSDEAKTIIDKNIQE